MRTSIWFTSKGTAGLVVMLLTTPGSVGDGYRAIAAVETGLRRLCGMRFPGKASRIRFLPVGSAGSGWMLSGSKIVFEMAEKSPARMASVGTVVILEALLRWRLP